MQNKTHPARQEQDAAHHPRVLAVFPPRIRFQPTLPSDARRPSFS